MSSPEQAFPYSQGASLSNNSHMLSHNNHPLLGPQDVYDPLYSVQPHTLCGNNCGYGTASPHFRTPDTPYESQWSNHVAQLQAQAAAPPPPPSQAPPMNVFYQQQLQLQQQQQRQEQQQPHHLQQHQPQQQHHGMGGFQTPMQNSPAMPETEMLFGEPNYGLSQQTLQQQSMYLVPTSSPLQAEYDTTNMMVPSSQTYAPVVSPNASFTSNFTPYVDSRSDSFSMPTPQAPYEPEPNYIARAPMPDGSTRSGATTPRDSASASRRPSVTSLKKKASTASMNKPEKKKNPVGRPRKIHGPNSPKTQPKTKAKATKPKAKSSATPETATTTPGSSVQEVQMLSLDNPQRGSTDSPLLSPAAVTATSHAGQPIHHSTGGDIFSKSVVAQTKQEVLQILKSGAYDATVEQKIEAAFAPIENSFYSDRAVHAQISSVRIADSRRPSVASIATTATTMSPHSDSDVVYAVSPAELCMPEIK